MNALADFPGVDRDAAARARDRIDNLTKPVGSLGRIEELAVQLCAIAGRLPDRAYDRFAVLVAAGDHGVVAEGVSAYPQEVTPQMVGAFLAGHAAVNAFARTAGADVFVVNAGVIGDLPAHPSLIDARIRRGTRNFAREAALTDDEVRAALDAGAAAIERIVASGAYDAIALGEMGIGNTTCATAIVSAVTGADPATVVGRGTGISDDVLSHKAEVVRASLARFASRDCQTIAREVGGLEVLVLAGAMLEAAKRRIPVVLDGFIVSSAALLAVAIAPHAREYLIASHRSQEPGHRIALEALGLRPLLDLDLRLGEATGAVLTLPLIQAATRMMCEMQTFAEAGVATKIE